TPGVMRKPRRARRHIVFAEATPDVAREPGRARGRSVLAEPSPGVTRKPRHARGRNRGREGAPGVPRLFPARFRPLGSRRFFATLGAQSAMKMRKLGRTDVMVPEICLGTMTWGLQNTEAEGHAQMDYAFEHGINFFDTAEMYAVPASAETYGKTEEIIGTWFKKTGNRDKVILASKVAGGGRPWVRGGRGIDAASVREAVENSLRRLQTDYIDLYQIHWPRRGHYHWEGSWDYDPYQQNREEVL